MSSLSATQADGYYVPPSYLDSGAYKKQSVSKFAGSKGHNQYLTRSVVRFELPYDGFCGGCGCHVGKGTRFNAHKAHVGDYHSTKIWEFTTKCRGCAEVTFKIRTDPAARGFDYVVGIKRKVEEWDTREAGTAGVIDTDVGEGIHHGGASGAIGGPSDGSSDALSKLEKSALGERKAMTERDRMEALLAGNSVTMYDDDSSNSLLRSTYRKARKAKKRRLGEAAASGLGMGIELSEPRESDGQEAREVFGQSRVLDERARKKERGMFQKLRTGTIFGAGSSSIKKVVRGGSGVRRESKGAAQASVVNEVASSVESTMAPLGPRGLSSGAVVKLRRRCISSSTEGGEQGGGMKERLRGTPHDKIDDKVVRSKVSVAEGAHVDTNRGGAEMDGNNCSGGRSSEGVVESPAGRPSGLTGLLADYGSLSSESEGDN